MNSEDFKIDKTKNGLEGFCIKKINGGEVPKDLRGYYSSPIYAQNDIEKYLKQYNVVLKQMNLHSEAEEIKVESKTETKTKITKTNKSKKTNK